MTLTERWGRLFVSVNYAQRVTHHQPAPKRCDARAGMDVGMRRLATVSARDATTGQTWYERFPAIKPLDATLTRRRGAGRKMSRRIRGSRGYLAAKAEVARLDRRCVNLRREAAHQITRWLVSTFGQVVIEDLDLAAMKKSMGRKAFRRHVSDAAMGAFRPLLSYKAPQHGCDLVIADRWFASSWRHHGCTDPDGNQCWLIARHKMDKMLLCPVTGEQVDRDDNAADNLRDWPDLPVDAQSERRPRSSARPETPQPGDGGLDHAPKRGRRSGRKTKRTPRGPSTVRPEPTPDTRQRNSERSATR
jgi:putative transposase